MGSKNDKKKNIIITGKTLTNAVMLFDTRTRKSEPPILIHLSFSLSIYPSFVNNLL